MPSITPQTELDQLLVLIAAQPDGIGIDAIAQALGDSLKRRTLQRRLATLVAQGQVQMVGEARATRYVRTPQVVTGLLSADATVADTLQATGEVYVPVSPEGEAIKAYVRQPRAMRSVGENVINQGLFYLDWLMDHKAEFKLLVLDKLGAAAADAIDWSAPRVVCIAADFTKYGVANLCNNNHPVH